MGELAEPQVQTEGVPLAREIFMHKQYSVRNLLQKIVGQFCGSPPSTVAGATVPLPRLGEALRKHPPGAVPLAREGSTFRGSWLNRRFRLRGLNISFTHI